MTGPQQSFTAQQAAAITGIPLQTLKNAVSQRLLKGAVRRSGGRQRLDRPGMLAFAIAHSLAPRFRLPLQHVYAAVKADPTLRRPQEIAPGVTLNVRKAVQPVLDRLAAYDRAASRLVTTDAAIMGGAPCLTGTRLPVHMISQYLANGDSVTDIREAYPQLSVEQIEAAQLYAKAKSLAWALCKNVSRRFLIDACLPRALASPVHGFDSLYALDVLGDGATDVAITALAAAEDRIIVTADIKDFSLLATTTDLPPVVLIDLGTRLNDTVALALSGMAEAASKEAAQQLWPGSIIRVRRNGRIAIRVRGRSG